MPLISVILRTYNRPHMLTTMLDCLRNQDYDNYEIILYNNGSQDKETESICKAYADGNPRVLYVYQSVNSVLRGVMGGFAEISFAKGDYVAWVDDDDRIEPNYLSFLANLIDKHQADIVMCGSYNEYADGSLTPNFVGNEERVFDQLGGLKVFLERMHFNTAPPGKAFKRSLLLDVDYQAINNVVSTVGRNSQDVLTTYRFLAVAKKIVVHNQPLYYFKKHDDNISGFQHDDNQWSPELMKTMIEVYEIRKRYLLERQPALKPAVDKATHGFMTSMLHKIEIHQWEGYEKIKAYMEAYLDVF